MSRFDVIKQIHGSVGNETISTSRKYCALFPTNHIVFDTIWHQILTLGGKDTLFDKEKKRQYDTQVFLYFVH